MTINRSGRTPESAIAIQELARFLEGYGEVAELDENVLRVDGRETLLVTFSAQNYYDRKGYYWFSLAKTKYARLHKENQNHAWVVLICGAQAVSYTHLRAHETVLDLVCRLLLAKKNIQTHLQ